ncbi:hypothetical protein, partial [Flavobacterium psychrophilum]|uniref:hypothetical protein n=1 Tax=Flavobacterium psychrophilum TaxID=96345 RepID=UPI003138FDA3
LPSPALLDFLREQALSKTPQSGGSLAVILRPNGEFKYNKMKNEKKFSFYNIDFLLFDFL